MGTMKRQEGISFLGLLIILALCAAVGLFGLKVLPLYLDYASVSKAFDDLPGTPNLGKQGSKAILDRLKNQMDVDDVKTFNPRDKNQFKITKSKDKKSWVVSADYEARANYVKNIYVVIHFQKTVAVPR